MGNARINHRSHPGTTSEQTHDLRAHAWAYIFTCYARKKAAPESRPDDAEGESNDTRADTILPQEP